MAPEQTELLRLVDPAALGRRVRAARETAGLDLAGLAALAGLRATHLADVEAGRARPTLLVLSAVAEHTCTCADVLLLGLPADLVPELYRRLDNAALGLTAGTAAPALRTADQVLDLLAAASLPFLELAARRLRASALESLGDLAGAVAELRRATAVPVAEVAWIRDLISLSRCHRELGELDEAIAAGEDATTTIRQLGLAETTEAIQLTVTVAAAYLVRGDVRHGARLCRRAADRADAYGLPVAKASAMWNASCALDAGGDPAAGLALALEALAIYERLGETRLVGRLRIDVVTLQLKTPSPDLDSALAMLDRARVELEATPSTHLDAARHRLCAARVRHSLGDHERAADLLRESEALTPAGAADLRAWQSALRGRLAAGRGDAHRAREHFLTAVHTLVGNGSDKDAAQLWFELGDTLTTLGEDELALQAFRSAGASQGLRAPVLTTLPRMS
ncbi:helix-turn-helix domain-containing protein [Pimelobacter simplex]|uniref:helix-turn-helix domain-containing protein n=1 Tax=Nocardioides simplex TaxID=2045 RepID=UPI0038265BB5